MSRRVLLSIWQNSGTLPGHTVGMRNMSTVVSPKAPDSIRPIARAARKSRRKEEWRPSILQMGTVMVACSIFFKLLMIYDETKEPERIARKARKMQELQEQLPPMTPARWNALQQVRPRTPFESRVSRDGARIRTDEKRSWEDVRNWAKDVILEALERRESAVRGA